MKTSLLIFITCFHSLVFAAPIDDSIKRGTQFLLEEQKPDGSWGGATRTKHLNIYAPGARAHLAFKNATTALCLTALKKSLSKDSAVQSAVARGYEYLVKTADEVKRVDGRWIGNVWTHAFTIQALLLYEDRTDKMDLIIKKQLGLLKSYQGLDGGWGYYDFKAQTLKPSGSSVSFLTGTVLIILKKAEQSGFEIDQTMLDKSLRFLASQRKPDNSFLYSNDFKYHTNIHINKKIGSLARSQSSLRGLYDWQYDDVKAKEVAEWVNFIIKRNMWLDMARKRPVPHESWNQIASYFYYYGMYHAADNLVHCSDKRQEYSEKLAQIIIDRQEKGGSWFDFPLYDYGHCYGTAYAILALSACRI